MSRVTSHFALLLSSVVVSLVIAEAIMRLFVPQETKRLAMYDEDLGWRGRPHGSGIFIRKKDGIEAPFRYNELGFRDDPIRQRSEVSKRIIFLGDSFVEGLELPFEKTFLHLVKQRLRAASPGADVVSVASQGYSSAQEYLALRKFYEFLKPDAVILFFYTGNDYSDNLRREFAYLDAQNNLVFPPQGDSWFKQNYLSFKRWLYESSHLVFYLKNMLESIAAVKLEDDTKHIEKSSPEYTFEITRKLIRELKTYVEGQGASFGLALICGKKDLKGNNRERVGFIGRLCREAGISYLELSHLDPDNHFFNVDEHLTESGHRIVADSMYSFVVRAFPFMVEPSEASPQGRRTSAIPYHSRLIPQEKTKGAAASLLTIFSKFLPQ